MLEKENKNDEELKLDEEMEIIEDDVPNRITQLANKMGISRTEIIKTLMRI